MAYHLAGTVRKCIKVGGEFYSRGPLEETSAASKSMAAMGTFHHKGETTPGVVKVLAPLICNDNITWLFFWRCVCLPYQYLLCSVCVCVFSLIIMMMSVQYVRTEGSWFVVMVVLKLFIWPASTLHSHPYPGEKNTRFQSLQSTYLGLFRSNILSYVSMFKDALFFSTPRSEKEGFFSHKILICSGNWQCERCCGNKVKREKAQLPLQVRSWKTNIT